jgi:seryl-tRNA synthetase
MDNRSIYEIAAAESPAYVAAERRVDELERGRDRLRTEVDELQRESEILSANIAAGNVQLEGPATRDVLDQKLADLNATLKNVRASFVETSRALEAATAERDEILARFRESR